VTFSTDSVFRGLVACALLIGCKEKEPSPVVVTNAAQVQKVASPSGSAIKDAEIDTLLRQFKSVLASNSSATLDSLVDPSGLTVIRNFTSGSLGGRGENIRNFYAVPISSKIASPEFPVPNETPIKLSAMFPDLRKSSESAVMVFADSIEGFGIHDDSTTVNPTTKVLIDALTSIATKHDDVPTTFVSKVNGEYLVLAEGDAVDGICTGYYSIFVKTTVGYRLKVVLDLR